MNDIDEENTSIINNNPANIITNTIKPTTAAASHFNN